MTKAKKKASAEKEIKIVPTRAILVEVDNVAIAGRQLVFDALRKALSARGIELNIAAFCKYCVDMPARHFVPRLLKISSKTRLSEDKLVEDVTDAINAAFAPNGPKIEAGFKGLLKRAEQEDVRVAGISFLDREKIGGILEKQGLSQLTVVAVTRDDDGRSPETNGWLKLAKVLGLPPSQCMALATGAISNRTAISAKMKCVALPDRFTAFQDFSGADHVFQTLSGDTVKTVFDLLKTLG